MNTYDEAKTLRELVEYYCMRCEIGWLNCKISVAECNKIKSDKDFENVTRPYVIAKESWNGLESSGMIRFDPQMEMPEGRCTSRDEYGNADINGVDMSFLLGLDYEQLCTMQQALNRLADFEDTLAESRWIPCSVRMPEDEDMYRVPDNRYLCQLEAYGQRKFCVCARLKGELSPFWDWYGIPFRDSEVVAWMPLPEPYKGVTE